MSPVTWFPLVGQWADAGGGTGREVGGFSAFGDVTTAAGTRCDADGFIADGDVATWPDHAAGGV